MKIALCPGSFDPVTLGHTDLIERAARLFDKVYVCAMINAEKPEGFFSLDERLQLLRLAVAPYKNVEADIWDGLCIDYAHKVGACALVKGVRTAVDLRYELDMAAWNRSRAPDTETLLLPARKELSGISATLVRERLSAGKSINDLVPPRCAERIQILKGR